MIAGVGTVTETMRRRLEDDPRITAAYVFGSTVAGTESARSDVDVAITTDGSLSFEDELALRADLQAGAPGTEVDLTVLDTASPLLRYEVVASGRRLFARDEPRADAAELAWVAEYMDTAYFRRIQQDLQREALQ